MVQIDLFASILGAVGGIIQRGQELRHQERLAALKAVNDDLANARSHRFQFARRTVIIILTLYLFVGPVLASWFHMPFLVGVEESNGWLPAIFNGDVDIVFKLLPSGYPFLPIQLFLASMVFTFYFGRGGT